MKDQELLVVLKEHLDRYPKMQPQDVVKLLYQGEFGPGHMIKDPAASLKRLEDEYAHTEHAPRMGLTEDIGNGFVRVNLAALDMGVCSLEKLSALFVLSANQTSGDMNRFQEKLEMIKDHFAGLCSGRISGCQSQRDLSGSVPSCVSGVERRADI